MSAVTTELQPVISALYDAARCRAGMILSEADRDATAERAGGRAEAERILHQARLDGTAAAERVALERVTGARRHSRQAVLAAQAAAYEVLRAKALAALALRASTPEGKRLSGQLVELVQDRVGGPARSYEATAGELEVTAERDNRRASIGAADLVEQALHTLSDEVTGLWA